ncbi:MAG: type II toxin-antitoxin system RelE/ParE family toxin [Gemmatimonadota bacterium]|nr:type II toxin-antitoxin system RelE/ParE family toxin [Gemmatimonadota bacterium]
MEDLKIPLRNRFHALGWDRAGQHSISINDQWRICFRFQDSDSHDVEVCDCH